MAFVFSGTINAMRSKQCTKKNHHKKGIMDSGAFEGEEICKVSWWQQEVIHERGDSDYG